MKVEAERCRAKREASRRRSEKDDRTQETELDMRYKVTRENRGSHSFVTRCPVSNRTP